MREPDIQRNKKKFKKCTLVTGKAVFPLELCGSSFVDSSVCVKPCVGGLRQRNLGLEFM